MPWRFSICFKKSETRRRRTLRERERDRPSSFSLKPLSNPSGICGTGLRAAEARLPQSGRSHQHRRDLHHDRRRRLREKNRVEVPFRVTFGDLWDFVESQRETCSIVKKAKETFPKWRKRPMRTKNGREFCHVGQSSLLRWSKGPYG